MAAALRSRRRASKQTAIVQVNADNQATIKIHSYGNHHCCGMQPCKSSEVLAFLVTFALPCVSRGCTDAHGSANVTVKESNTVLKGLQTCARTWREGEHVRMMGSSVHQADHLTTISAQCLQVALGSSKFARSRRPSAVWSPHTRGAPGPFLITSLPVKRHRGLPVPVPDGKKTPGGAETHTGHSGTHVAPAVASVVLTFTRAHESHRQTCRALPSSGPCARRRHARQVKP